MLKALPDPDPRMWLPAKEARDVVEKVFGLNAQPSARETIITRLRNGLIGARCRSVNFDAKEIGRPPDGRGSCELTPEFWEKIHTGTENWRSNDFRSYGRVPHYGSAFTHAFDVEFCDDDIRKIYGVPPRLPPTGDGGIISLASRTNMDAAVIHAHALASVAAVAPLAKRRAGGRPPNPLFEEALNHVWKAIYEGFTPDLQADIETKIAEWFSDNGQDEPGVTQIRQRARMIWQALGN